MFGKSGSESLFFTPSAYQYNADIMESDDTFIINDKTYIPIDWYGLGLGSTGTASATYRFFPLGINLKKASQERVIPTLNSAGTLKLSE